MIEHSLHELLATYRENARTEREKGNYFERLAVAFIKNDPGMRQEYEDAWLYPEWAATHGVDGRDTGIDAVAKIRGEDSFCAIQCKFYRDGHRIQKADIDSFFTASGKKHFSRRLIIDTTDTPWSANADDALSEQDKPVSRIGIDRLRESPIDWSAYILRDEIKVAAKKEIRPNQSDALKAVREGLREADRGKLIMACGTGKTFTGLKIAEDMAGAGSRVLFLVPSLALMSQTIREWTIDTAISLRAFAVCSDTQVGKRQKSSSDIAEIEAHDLDYPATTSAAKLAARANTPDAERMTVVFARSLPAYVDKPLHELMEMKDAKRMSPESINKYLRTYTAFFDWAVKLSHTAENNFKGLVTRLRNDEQARDAFTDEQIKTMLDVILNNRNGVIRKQYQKWGVLIALYTGARLNEIAQLAVDDIIQVDGVWCFSFNDDDEKTLKNIQSKRNVPIHSHLLELGILELAESLRKSGKDRLLHELTKADKKNGYGRNLGRWVNDKFLPALGMDSPRLVFHSFRHTVTTWLFQAGVDEPIVKTVIGHSQQGVTHKV